MNRLARIFLQEPAAATPADPPESAPEAVPAAWLPPVPAPVGGPVVPRSPVVIATDIAAAPVIAVVCAPRDARLAGSAAGLALSRAVGAPCALVLEWGGSPRRPGADRPAVPAARRLVARLTREGLSVRAAGRLVLAVLPDDEVEAMQLAARCCEAGAPAVTVIAGPRAEPSEAWMAETAAVVLLSRPEADEELTGLAAEELERLGPPLVACALDLSPVASLLARGGINLAASLRGPLEAALGGPG